jgi:tRNA A37 threonylcarbamoyladenosine modification protein TsaB
MNCKTTARPITLAIELSQRTGSIAMSNRSGETCVKQTEASKRDVDEVMPAIATAADELGINPIDVELIVVAIGGSLE